MIERILNRNNPFLIFLPFLAFYCVIVIIFNTEEMQGDEIRYYEFANNLLNGFYSPPLPNFSLRNGPGYPIFLMPFAALKTPALFITLCNALFQYLSIPFLYKSLSYFVSKRTALLFSIFWGLYYVAYQNMAQVYTESITIFLLSVFSYLVIKAVREDNKKHLLSSGIIFGYLVLTKIAFGYILILMLFISLLFFIIKKSRIHKQMSYIFLVAFIITVPYLIYTYSITGKYFYWGSSGGETLYWMTTPFPNEYGDWNSGNFDANCDDPSMPCHAQLIANNHKTDLDYVNSFPPIERDDVFKELAFNNIQKFPLKYLRNCLANTGRLFFGVPNSFAFQKDKTLMRFFPGAFLFFLMVYSLIVTLLNWVKTNPEVNYLVFLTFTYIFLSILASSQPRQLFVIVPLILLWSGIMIEKTVKINLRYSDS